METIEFVNELVSELLNGFEKMTIEKKSGSQKVVITMLKKEETPIIYKELEFSLAKSIFNRLLTMSGINYFTQEESNSKITYRRSQNPKALMELGVHYEPPYKLIEINVITRKIAE